jgi:hypothetical protein
MTHATSFTVLPALSEAFDAPGSATALKAVIDAGREVFDLSGSPVAAVGGDEANFAAMKAAFITPAAEEACFVLFKHADGVWGLYAFIPDDAPVKQKMLYASSRATLLKALGGADRLPREATWKELDEVALEQAMTEAARKEEEKHLMTGVERLKMEADAMQAVEAAGSKVSGVGLSLPTTPDAAAALASFREGTCGVVILAVAKETVTLISQHDGAGTTPEQLRPLIPSSDACYVLYRWAHEREGAATSAVLFLYMCAESAPVRSKMLHASTKCAHARSATRRMPRRHAPTLSSAVLRHAVLRHAVLGHAAASAHAAHAPPQPWQHRPCAESALCLVSGGPSSRASPRKSSRSDLT